MKNLIGVIILAVLCIILGIALITTNNRAKEEKRVNEETIASHTNTIVKVTRDLDEQRQVNIALTNNLSARVTDILNLTNKFTEVSATLAQTEASLKALQEDMQRKEQEIADLEKKNQQLDQQTLDLSTAITNLTAQIAETQRKLAASEGDKAFLEKELKRLMTEKAELERQFNDLAVLREQVRKLKDELSLARRLDWIRKGLYGPAGDAKGAQALLQRGPGAIQQPTAVRSNAYDLNVEINKDGSVRVIPPLTNSPTPPK
jgi:myosin heavy subunit